jgi:hypothetical protein
MLSIVPPPSSTDRVERLRRAWHAQAGGAREQALFSLLIAFVVGGAHLARLGTSWARLAAGAAVVLVVAAQITVAVLRRREAASMRLTVQRILTATDPALGSRALRALRLLERTGADETEGSPELAELHFSRLVDRVSNDAVKSAALRYAQRFRGLAIVLLCAALFAVIMGPGRVVEGLDVLAARHGRAPLPMTWLGYARVSALPPSYTREPERALVFGATVSLPKGTVVTVRGVPVASDRPLVVTDGRREEAFVDDGSGGVVARYVVGAPVALKVAARFGDVRIEEEDSLDLAVVPDRPPTVELEGAPRSEKLSEMTRIDLRWVAHDDHGLREVDMVMRSGVREERRVLARFDGETKVERGGHVVTPRDAFLRNMYLPISVRVEAKDNDPLDGPKWAGSPAILVIPPEVGEPEAERFAALVELRDRLVDFLKWRIDARNLKPDLRAKEARARLDALGVDAEGMLAKTYSGLPVQRGLASFVRGQLDKLRGKKADPDEKTSEDVLLAIDVARGAAGSRDAVEVAKRLADIAEEAALGARIAREPEHGQNGVERLDGALQALEKGVLHLSTLGALGKDVGSVGVADTGRVRRSRVAKDYVHAELAALHLAARLRRPAPSFGSSGGGGSRGGGGVESGSGRGSSGGQLPSPSSADRDFDRAANAVSELTQEHEGTLRGVESAMDEAKKQEPSEAERREAKRIADEVRRAVDPLPLPGQEFGTPRAGAALAREHGSAAAHALDEMSLESARDSADSALQALEQAEQRMDPNDPSRGDFAGARKALSEASAWAQKELEERRAQAEAKAGGSLRQAGDTERDLSERAEKLGAEPGAGDAPLPKETGERLRRAASVMREATRELAAGHGDHGLELQREAQRLLEQARPGRAGDSDREEEDNEGKDRSSRKPESEQSGNGGESIATGGDVPGPDDKARAEDFRRRVLEGLGKEKSERLSPAVKRYAEGLLR